MPWLGRGLRSLLQDHDGDGCRIVVSGWPHSLQRHWEGLFATSLDFGWRFVQLDEFDPDQQPQFLGRTCDGRERYTLVVETAREHPPVVWISRGPDALPRRRSVRG